MSPMYKAMIATVHSTIVIYEKDIVVSDKMTVDDFRQKNPELVQRISEEVRNIYEYELSWEQMSRGIAVYLQVKKYPQSVFETEAYTPKESWIKGLKTSQEFLD